MRIFFAALEPKELAEGRNVLLSYYDIHISDIPFRKRTWEIIIGEGKTNESLPGYLAGRNKPRRSVNKNK